MEMMARWERSRNGNMYRPTVHERQLSASWDVCDCVQYTFTPFFESKSTIDYFAKNFEILDNWMHGIYHHSANTEIPS